MTPCEKAANGAASAKTLLEETEIKNRIEIATNSIATNQFEKGFNFGTKNDGSYTGSDVKTGTEFGLNLNATDPNFTVKGSAHTHPLSGFDCYSAADCYGFITVYETNSAFSTIFVFGATGSTYNITITDPVKFNNFKTNYSEANYLDENGHWKEGSSIRIDFNNVEQKFKDLGKNEDEAYALAQAYVLRKYNTGMSFSKKESDGNFKPIFIKEIKDSVDPTKISYEQTNDCNL